MRTIKQCTRCNIVKDLSEYYKRNGGKNKNSYCKSCNSEVSKQYLRTKDGLVSKIYGAQILSSKRRGHNAPTYTKKELKHWLFSQKKFHVLYDNYQRLDYQKDYLPSVDRKDDYIGYTMDNIQLMTWKENNEKNTRDIKAGINNKLSKGVIQLTKDLEFVSLYYSVHQASRETGISRANIGICCQEKRRTAGGFVWRYA